MTLHFFVIHKHSTTRRAIVHKCILVATIYIILECLRGKRKSMQGFSFFVSFSRFFFFFVHILLWIPASPILSVHKYTSRRLPSVKVEDNAQALRLHAQLATQKWGNEEKRVTTKRKRRRRKSEEQGRKKTKKVSLLVLDHRG